MAKDANSWLSQDSIRSFLLLAYLLLTGVGASIGVLLSFPTDDISNGHPEVVFPSVLWPGQGPSIDQGFLLLAALAGIAGSFLHAGQSLTAYLGNQEFERSWTAWYFLRPWIGGVLGLSVYFTFRAGLVAGASTVNPYGVVALGLLGGWFSQTTGDKLKEVFETLFKTDEDRKRKHKLRSEEKPEIKVITPSPVPTEVDEIKLYGRGFLEGALVLLGGTELRADVVNADEIRISLQELGDRRPRNRTRASAWVVNPSGAERLSEPVELEFE